MADSIGAFPSLQTVAKALGGEVNGGQVLAPGPGHSAKDRSLSVKIDGADFSPTVFLATNPSPAAITCASGLAFPPSSLTAMAVVAH